MNGKAAKKWENYKRAALVLIARELKIKGAARMKKSQLVWWLQRKCEAPQRESDEIICKERRIRKVRGGNNPIFSVIGKNLKDLRKIAKSYGIKQSGRKATVANRIRRYLLKAK